MEDYQAALNFIRNSPEVKGKVDASRVAIWGTSFAGGHVLNVAANDDAPESVGAIRAIISQAREIISVKAYFEVASYTCNTVCVCVCVCVTSQYLVL